MLNVDYSVESLSIWTVLVVSSLGMPDTALDLEYMLSNCCLNKQMNDDCGRACKIPLSPGLLEMEWFLESVIIQKVYLKEMESRMVVTRSCGKRKWGDVALHVQHFQLCKMDKF